jgi:hypothetical protein
MSGRTNEQRRYRVSAAADALSPDDDTGRKSKQDRDAGQNQRPRESGKRRHNLERSGTYDDYRDEGRRERKHRNATRPNGEPRDRCLPQ